MPDQGEEFLRHAKATHQDAMNLLRRETEIPMTTVLSPEAREDAMKVAKDVWIESMKLLGDKDKVIRSDPTKAKNNLIIEGKRKMDATIFKGADLGMTRYSFEYDGDAQHSTQELWHFYPDHVQKTIRHSSQKSDTGEFLPPRGLATEKVEADKEELSSLLQDIRSSVEFKPSFPL